MNVNQKVNDMMMKLHQGKTLAPKGYVEVVNAVGWVAEEKMGVYKERHLQHRDSFRQRLELSDDFRVSIHETESNAYEFYCKTREDAEYLQVALKKFELPAIPLKIKKKEMYVLNVTPIRECSGGYYDYVLNAEVWFAMPQIWFMSPECEEYTIMTQTLGTIGYETYNFPTTVFFKRLKNKVNEVLGLEDFEIEKQKKAEIARLRKINGHAGHCPICGRLQMLRKVGDKLVMVHHGYQRPGIGEIVGDCFGVNYQAYELSNEGNVAYAPVLVRRLKNTEDRLAALQSGKVLQLSTGLKRKPTVTPNDRDWEVYLKAAINQVEQYIKYVKQDIETNQKLIDEWKLQPLPKVE